MSFHHHAGIIKKLISNANGIHTVPISVTANCEYKAETLEYSNLLLLTDEQDVGVHGWVQRQTLNMSDLLT